MNLATIKNCIVAVMLVGVLAFSADPAAAARKAVDVQASVADLKDALADLNAATHYFNSDGNEGTSSILSGLMDFTGTLKVRKADGARILAAFVADSRSRDRRDQMIAIIGRLDETTTGSGAADTLRDVFYYDFVNSIRRISGPAGALKAQLNLMFGERIGARLYENYRLAVSRTR